MSPTRILAVALATATMITACGVDPEVDPTTAASSGPEPTEVAEGGFGAPSRSGNEFATGSTAYQVTGSVEVAENGCWYVTLNDSERLIVFPSGWEFAGSASPALQGPDGEVVDSGDEIDGTVRLLHEDELPADGKWANYVGFCQPDVLELAVFDQLTSAYDPATLTVDDQRAAIAGADFTEHWPCGRGWAGSTADQRIGIMIYQVDDMQPTPGPVLGLPDPGWTADVVVGKHLFANHCNDAIEEWMPTPNVVARYPLSGTVTLEDPAPSNSEPPAMVGAVLTDGYADIDGVAVPLRNVQLRNEAYNAFAG